MGEGRLKCVTAKSQPWGTGVIAGPFARRQGELRLGGAKSVKSGITQTWV